MQPVISSLLAAALVLTPQLAAAQPAKAAKSPVAAAKAGAAGQIRVSCPFRVPATIPTPKGFSTVNWAGSLRSDHMQIDNGGTVYCLYGDAAFQYDGAKNCSPASGMWSGASCTQPGADVPYLECFATCPH